MKLTKKTAKIINIIVIAIATLLVMNTIVFAAAATDGYGSITASSSTLQGCMATITGSILGIVQTIGMAVAIIMLVVLAIKYISAAPNDKAEIKKLAVIYIVGAVVLFAASGIVGLIKTWSSSTVK